MIRVVLPYHLRKLAHSGSEVQLAIDDASTIAALLDALEAQYPMLAGTIRDHDTHQRRPFLRFFACGDDLSLETPETRLPQRVVSGEEPFLIIGALAGG